jgi:5-methylcytosine-specific restriction endonuclease McrA
MPFKSGGTIPLADSAAQYTSEQAEQNRTVHAELYSSFIEESAVAEMKYQTKIEIKNPSRYIPIDLKRFVFARSKGQCEFVDSRTKARCHSTHRLQIDHHIPLALGGQTTASNLRHLCSAHNLRMATQAGLHKSSRTIKYF